MKDKIICILQKNRVLNSISGTESIDINSNGKISLNETLKKNMDLIPNY